MTGALHENLCTFITLCWNLRTRNVSHKSCTPHQITHFRFNNIFYQQSCRLWDNAEERGTARQDTDDNILFCIRNACHITKARIPTHNHSI